VNGGAAIPTINAGWSAVALMDFLFMAPTDCVVLDAYRMRCREPAGGLLRGGREQQRRRSLRQRFTRVPGAAAGGAPEAPKP
jgi:hypothetical protein